MKLLAPGFILTQFLAVAAVCGVVQLMKGFSLFSLPTPPCNCAFQINNLKKREIHKLVCAQSKHHVRMQPEGGDLSNMNSSQNKNYWRHPYTRRPDVLQGSCNENSLVLAQKQIFSSLGQNGNTRN